MINHPTMHSMPDIDMPEYATNLMMIATISDAITPFTISFMAATVTVGRWHETDDGMWLYRLNDETVLEADMNQFNVDRLIDREQMIHLAPGLVYDPFFD